MMVHGIRRILTFNAQDFARFGALEILAPEQIVSQQKPPGTPP